MKRSFLHATTRTVFIVCTLSACAHLESPTGRSSPSAPQASPNPSSASKSEPGAPAEPLPRAHGAAERERLAKRLEARGDLSRALVQWKLLRLLEPDNAEWPRRVSSTQRHIGEKVGDLLARGEAALKAGDSTGASEALFQALALDPREKKAAQLLREIEAGAIRSREQAKVEKLGRRSVASGNGRAPRPSQESQASYYLETGIALYDQGDYEKSLVEFEKYLDSFPDDRKARGYLAEAHLQLGKAALKSGNFAAATSQFDEARKNGERRANEYLRQAKRKMAGELYEQGVRVSRSDLSRAIEYWRECLTYDAGHVGARKQLDRALKMQERLKTIH